MPMLYSTAALDTSSTASTGYANYAAAMLSPESDLQEQDAALSSASDSDAALSLASFNEASPPSPVQQLLVPNVEAVLSPHNENAHISKSDIRNCFSQTKR